MSAFDSSRSGDRPPRFSKPSKARAIGWSVLAPLDDRDQHPCPICNHGQLQAMAMMDEAWACDFCRHLFTLDLSAQILRVEDSIQPLQWRWMGRSWQPVRHSSDDLTPAIWIVAAGLAIGPVGIIGLSQYLFPPLPGARSVGFSQGWFISAAIGHLILAAWLLLEHYQLPLYVSLKLRWQDWRSRLNR